MLLVHAPDGVIDEHDRAIWVTPPFNLAWAGVGPYSMVAAEVFTAGIVQGELFEPGAIAAEVFVSGTVEGEVFEPGAIAAEAFEPGSVTGEVV